MKLLLLGGGVLLALGAAMAVAGLVANRLPLGHPPGLLPRLAVYLTRNVAETGPESGFPELAPFQLSGEPGIALQRVAEACRSLQWDEIAVDPAARRVSAVVRSRMFRFCDDVDVILYESSLDGVVAKVRSASRLGRGDLGANARHVMDLRAQLAAMGLLRDAQQT